MKYPDTATQEMSIYGSAYHDVKMALHDMNRIKASLTDRLNLLIKMLDDESLDIADMVLAEHQDIILSEESLPEDIDIGDIIRILREILRTSTALQLLKDRADGVKMFGRAVGAGEYSDIMRRRGISEDVWSSAVIRYPQGDD
jgi:hypothetical protein